MTAAMILTTASSTRPDSSAGTFADDEFVSLGERLRFSPIVAAVSGEPDGAAPIRVAAALSRRRREETSLTNGRHIPDGSSAEPA